MDREHMALMARAGHTEYLTPLWEEVQGLCIKLMREFARRLRLPNWIDAEDITQCAYFGFLYAVAAYDPEKGFAFATYLGYHLRNAAVRQSGLPRHGGAYREVSGDAYIDEDESITLFDTVADERASDAYRAAELSDVQERIRAAMLGLTETQRHIIELRFWRGASFCEIAALCGADRSDIAAQYSAAMRKLRSARELRGLYEDYGRHYHDGALWQSTDMFGLSAEAAAVRREIARESRARYLSYGKRQAMMKAAYDRFMSREASGDAFDAHDRP